VFLSLSDASPKSAPAKGKKAKQASNSKEAPAPAPAPSKEVKHLASVQKILRFRSVDEDHQNHRTYQHDGKEF
jgi:general transcription factor 3C polypeptide 6